MLGFSLVRRQANSFVALPLLTAALGCSALWALTDALVLLIGAIAAGIGTVIAALLPED
jgi:hypothetical protein